MSMYNIIAVSNRKMCFDFFAQVKKISRYDIPVILREKDLSEAEYEALFKKAAEVCPNIILHNHIGIAKKLGHRAIHLPAAALKSADISGFDTVGASVHSVEEALKAQELGAAYVTFGHVFWTDCKKCLAPRGLQELQKVCSALEIPVYAIGGINPQNIQSAIDAGAFGACVMSGLMKCRNVDEYIKSYRQFGRV